MTRRFVFVGTLTCLAGLASASFAQDGGGGPTDAGVSEDAAIDATTPAEPPLPEEHRPSLAVRLEPTASITTGDIVRLHIVASLPEGDDITIPSQSFGSLELHGRRFTDTVRGGRLERHFVLDLLALAPGQLTLDPVQLHVVTSDGLVGSARTDTIRIDVRSVLGNEPNATPRGPTRPRRLMEEDPRPVYILGTLGAMLVGAILALLVRRWWQRRPKPVVPPPPPRPPWEIAFEKLEALRNDGPTMIAEGRVGPWIDSLSDTVREYLGKRYGFEGLECTSDEVLERIAALRIRTLSVTEMQVFLGECDLVKFAQASMTTDQAETMYRQAYRIVSSTMPGRDGFAPVQQGGAS